MYLLYFKYVCLFYYSKKALKDVVDAGRICIKDVDLNGVDTFKHSDINPLVICIKAPNIDVLVSFLFVTTFWLIFISS